MLILVLTLFCIGIGCWLAATKDSWKTKTRHGFWAAAFGHWIIAAFYPVWLPGALWCTITAASADEKLRRGTQ